MRPGVWHERAQIGPRTGWFWDPQGAKHAAKYLWAHSVVARGQILDDGCRTGSWSALPVGPRQPVFGSNVSAFPWAIAAVQPYGAAARIVEAVRGRDVAPTRPSRADISAVPRLRRGSESEDSPLRWRVPRSRCCGR